MDEATIVIESGKPTDYYEDIVSHKLQIPTTSDIHNSVGDLLPADSGSTKHREDELQIRNEEITTNVKKVLEDICSAVNGTPDWKIWLGHCGPRISRYGGMSSSEASRWQCCHWIMML